LKVGEGAQAKFKAFPMQQIADADQAKGIALPNSKTAELSNIHTWQAHL